MLYVDHAQIPYKHMFMSHLMADSSEELLQATRKLGLPPWYIQEPGTPKEHMDVGDGKRQDAIAMGAIEVTSRDLVRLIRKRREDMKHSPVDK